MRTCQCHPHSHGADSCTRRLHLLFINSYCVTHGLCEGKTETGFTFYPHNNTNDLLFQDSSRLSALIHLLVFAGPHPSHSGEIEKVGVFLLLLSHFICSYFIFIPIKPPTKLSPL